VSKIQLKTGQFIEEIYNLKVTFHLLTNFQLLALPSEGLLELSYPES